MQPRSSSDLFEELTRLCAEFEARTGISCRVVLDRRHIQAEEEVSEVLYRAVRELLTNVQRHAKAKSVEVASSLAGGWLEIAVSDDGIGFPAGRRKINPLDEEAIGLWSIDQRPTAFGGVLEIRCESGTRAAIKVPAAWLRR